MNLQIIISSAFKVYINYFAFICMILFFSLKHTQIFKILKSHIHNTNILYSIYIFVFFRYGNLLTVSALTNVPTAIKGVSIS